MRYVIVPLLAGFILSLLLVGSASAQVLHLDKDSVDFGTMNQHESRDTQVTVTNKGGGMLIISEVNADCGCTVPTLARKQLAPGESTVIDINFNSKKFHGNVTKLIHIVSNDPRTPDKTFFIQANVFASLLVEPRSQRLGFSQSPVGTSLSQEVVFTATEADELIIKASKSRKNLFQVSVVNNYEGDPQKSVMTVTIPTDMPSGRQRDNVRVKTNIDGYETVDIDLSAWPVLSLSTSLDKVNFRYKRDFTKAIHITPNVKDLEFKITKVECDLPEIQFAIEEPLPNKQSTIRLTGAPIDKSDPRAIKKKGRITGTLTIHTNLKDLPTMEVPLSYMIRM